MPSARRSSAHGAQPGSARSQGGAGNLSAQFSINDLLLKEMLGQSGDALAGGPSYTVNEFATLMKDQILSQYEQRLSRQLSLRGPNAANAAADAATAASPRSSARARRGAVAENTSSGSGKTMDQIWKDINGPSASGPAGPARTVSGASVGKGGTAAGGNLGSADFGAGGAMASLGIPSAASLGMGMVGGTSSLPLISQASLDALVKDNQPTRRSSSKKDDVRPAKEWLDLLLARSDAPKVQPTLSATIALERAAMGAEPIPVSPPKRAATGKKAAQGGGSGSRANQPPLAGRKRGRSAAAEEEPPRPVVNLPPKKKGRKKKGEVDTETEEEKKLRAEERQRKNRESAARSHRRKAQYTEDLERRAEAGERRIAALERENAKLKSELAKLRDAAAGAKRTASGNKSK